MKTFLRILARIKPYWGYLVSSIICMVFYALLSSVSLWMAIPFVKTIFYPQRATVHTIEKSAHRSTPADSFPLDNIKTTLKQKTDRLVLGATREETLKRLCLILLFAILLKSLFGYVQGYLMVHVEEGVSKDFRDALYEHFQRLPLSYFDESRAGVLISRVTNDVGVLNRSIRVIFTNLSRDPLLVFFYLVILVILSWKLTLVALAVMPASLWVITKIGLKLRKYSARSQQRMADVTTVLQETISGIRVVKAFAMEKFEVSKFRQATRNYFKTVLKRIRVGRLASPLTEFLGTIVGIVVLAYGGTQVLKGNLLAPEEFIIFLAVLFSLVDPLRRLGQANNRIQEGLAAGERVFQVLDIRPTILDTYDAITIETIREGIRFKDVSFRYDTQDIVLEDINLEIKVGQTLAIVGPTGAGKTTLVDLIPRFYDPYQGRVEIDGVDVRRIKLSSLRRLMGIVTQETILFNDTVWNNIAYGSPQIPEEKVIKAAKAANAHDFIVRLPQGYQTLIGDRGVRLSGGERQRLAIARAILKDPPILIFDEATSALDTESEISVQKAIERLMEGRTSLVIAHRLSTIQNADRIIVLDQGRIVQQGAHQGLIAQGGLYRTLYRRQFHGRD